MRKLGNLQQFFFGDRILPAVADVLPDGTCHHGASLGDQAYFSSPGVEAVSTAIRFTETDHTAVGFIQTGHQLEQRRLAGAIGADDCCNLILGDRTGELLHHIPLCIAEGDILKHNIFLRIRRNFQTLFQFFFLTIQL